MRRLIGLALLLYPRTWRRRYGGEFEALLDEVEPTAAVVADVVRGAVRAHLTERHRVAPETAGGPIMVTLLTPRRASRFGLAVVVALAVVALALGVGMVVAGLLAPDDAVSRFAIAVALATAAGGAGAWTTARLASDQVIAWSRPATAWLLTGTGIASVTAGALASWTVARFTYFDPEYVGVTLALPAAVMAVAIGSVVRATAAGGIRRASTILVILGATACAGIAALNVAGLRDGLSPESWGLGVAGGAALLYCAAAAAAALRVPGRVLWRD